MGRDFVDLKDGDRLEPYHINIIYKELRRLRKTQGDTFIHVEGMNDGDGVPTITGTFPRIGYLAVANGTISAAVNSAVGTGSVQVLMANGNSLINAQISEIAVYNPARDTANGTVLGEISSGKRVWIQKDGFGQWYVAPLECEDP